MNESSEETQKIWYQNNFFERIVFDKSYPLNDHIRSRCISV